MRQLWLFGLFGPFGPRSPFSGPVRGRPSGWSAVAAGEAAAGVAEAPALAGCCTITSSESEDRCTWYGAIAQVFTTRRRRRR
jgi:hypothetical protein